MRRPRLLLLAILPWLTACGRDAASRTSSTAEPLIASGVNATLTLQSDWGAGYCAEVTLQNTSAAAVTSWTAVIELNQSTVTNLWNGTVTRSGTQITVKPVAAWNSGIAPGASLGAFGFCATSSGSDYRPALVSLTVTGGSSGSSSDFALSANPANVDVAQGASGTSALTISRAGGFADGVAFTASGLPAGVSASFSPASTTGTSSTVTFAASAGASTGAAPVTITGSGGGLTHAVEVALTVSARTTTDATPPSAPGNLTATAATSSSVSLGWSASTDDVGVTGYDVYNGGTLAASVTATSATVTGLAASTAYTFTVKAKDAAGNVSPASGALTATTAAADGSTRHQAAYPPVDASTCGSWALTDNVCCARYCANDNRSEGCGSCGGDASPLCVIVSGKACKSGEWPEVHSVSAGEPWHYSRSTHFGLTSGGACGFGLYGLCTSQYKFNDACDAFCKAYPALCTDPAGTTLRGNFAAPPGNYYTQFWPSLPGDRDNYLSCGECFELARTKKDGTDYQPGESGYTPPVTLQIVDSCPCSANSKWCCGSGRDHCGEVSDFKYGCPLPPGPPDPPADHDPLPNESIHLDLSDIAMARLQTGSPGGSMVDGVIPTRYRRVACPVVGNVYVWLRSGAGPYWFSLSVVNAAGVGSITKVEAQLPSGAWLALVHDPNYTSSRPQERYGAWVVPQGTGPFALPMSLRITDPTGRAITATVTAWAPASASQTETYYIDTGAQF
jgi:hypothetical protein